jgi:hypothetical protein
LRGIEEENVAYIYTYASLIVLGCTPAGDKPQRALVGSQGLYYYTLAEQLSPFHW